MRYNTRLKYIGIDEYYKTQDALFSLGYTWASGAKCRLYGESLGEKSEGSFGLDTETKMFLRATVPNYYGVSISGFPYIDVELKEVIKYSLEPIKVREKVVIGEKSYYLDEVYEAIEKLKIIK